MNAPITITLPDGSAREFAAGTTAADVAASIDAAEKAVRVAEPTARVIYLEPDIYVEGHQPAARPEPPAPAGH